MVPTRCFVASKQALSVGRTMAVVGCVVVDGAAAAILLVGVPGWATALTAAVAAFSTLLSIIEIAVLLPRSLHHFQMAVSSLDLVISRGALFHRVDRIPLSKITMVRSRNGPLLRRHGILQCTIITATTEITLPPMAAKDVSELVAVSALPPLNDKCADRPRG